MSCVSFANDAQFVIGVGDSILVTVYNEPDLTVRAKVGNTGELKIPLLGDIRVVDKTPAELGRLLEQAYLDGYLVSPSVTVQFEAFRPYYIRGAVKNPGAYAFDFDLTVEQAIAVAGGLKDRASSKDWYILRGAEKARSQAEKNTLVFPGDIIEIQESLF